MPNSYWCLTNMSLKYNVVLVWVIYLSCKVVMTAGCEVVLVSRNVTDSFRVGEDGCTNNASVCTSSATCQSDGSCLCNADKPNFRNPVIIAEPSFMYGDSSGCVSSEFMRSGVAATVCAFKPFQVIPYSLKDEAIQFSYDLQNTIFQKCSLEKALAKFPDNVAEMELQWLNESYINLTVSSKTLYFKWKRLAPDLQGTIITFNLKCQESSGGYSTECLRAKVLGIWTAEANPTVSNPVVTKAPMTSALNSTGTMSMSPTTSARSSSLAEGSSSDGDSSGTIIIIAVVIAIILLIVLVVIIWCLCKRKKRYRYFWNSQRNSSDERSSKKNGTANLKQFRHTDSNLRGPDAYEDGQARDTNETFGAQGNLGYSTPDSQRVIVEANPMYAMPDIKRKEANYNPPGYEPVNMKKRQGNEDDSQADPGYATPDVNRREINRVNSYPEPGYETPDMKKKEINVATADSAYSTPEENNADIERIAVNGDLYALPDKNKSTKKINGLSYMDPSRLISGSQDGNESQAQSGQPTEYAEVVGVMKAAPKKPKTKK